MNNPLRIAILLCTLHVLAVSASVFAQPASGQMHRVLIVHFPDPNLYVTEVVPGLGRSVYAALRSEIVPGQRTFFVVATGTAPGWVLEVKAGVTSVMFGRALKKVAAILERSEPGMPGDDGHQTVQQIQYRLQSELNGLVVFENRILGAPTLTPTPSLSLTVNQPSIPVPVVKHRDDVYDAHASYQRSWTHVLLYFMLFMLGPLIQSECQTT